MVTRYLFIFWIKNPAAFHEEFWSRFVNIWVVMFSWAAQITFEVMLATDSYHIHVCTGNAQQMLLNGSSRVLTFNNGIRLFTVLLHTSIFTKIYAYKRKNRKQITNRGSSKFVWLKSLERKSLADITTNIITAICVVAAGVMQLQINFGDVSDDNRYLHYLYEYFYRCQYNQYFMSSFSIDMKVVFTTDFRSVCVYIFGQKGNWQKAGGKMLVKLTVGWFDLLSLHFCWSPFTISENEN